jgi:hypothetical protein
VCGELLIFEQNQQFATDSLIGTLRRECLDWIIPLSEGHLRNVLESWMAHYNRGRPQSSLGPGIPDPRLGDLAVDRHQSLGGRDSFDLPPHGGSVIFRLISANLGSARNSAISGKP